MAETSDLVDYAPNRKLALEWLANPKELWLKLQSILDREIDLASGEAACTCWYLLWCMEMYARNTSVSVDRQMKMNVITQFQSSPKTWLRAHLQRFGTRYFSYQQETKQLRLAKSALPVRSFYRFPSTSDGNWVVVTEETLFLALMEHWTWRKREWLLDNRWDLVKESAQLQKLARELFPAPVPPATVWDKLPACARKLYDHRRLFEARNQLLIMLKQSGAVLAEASAVAEDKTLAQKVYANQTHCWGCNTFQNKGYCPWVDIEDAAAAKCRRDCRTKAGVTKEQVPARVGISPEAFIELVNANIKPKPR